MSSSPVALVSGASSGIGLATALALARSGARVFAGVRDPEAEQLQEATRATEGRIAPVRLDVTDPDSVRACVDSVEAQAGPVGLLVNNAGVGGRGPVEAIDEATLRTVFETNFFGAVGLIRRVLPAMREARDGVIVTVSSIDARLYGLPLLWPYQASKHALSVMSEALALEVEQFGVRVRLIEPGFFATRIGANRRAREDRADPSWRRAGAPYAPLAGAVDGYLARGATAAADPAIVADAVVAACSDPARFPVRVVVGDDAQELDRSYVRMPEADHAARWRAHVREGRVDGG